MKVKKCCWCLCILLTAAIPVSAEICTYDLPGGEEYSSPDYNVTVEFGGKAHKSFVHYSHGLKQYDLYDWNGKHKETRKYKDRGVTSHSAAIFSFNGKVTVRVEVKKNVDHITLPLKSAKILPSSYNIPCTIEDGNTIVFTLDRPEKVVVLLNYDQAWDVFVKRGTGHVPAQSWKDTYSELLKQKSWHGRRLIGSLSEGYRNPLIILAHPLERNIPDKNTSGTLLIEPGDMVTQAEMDKYKTIWFAPWRSRSRRNPGIIPLSGRGRQSISKAALMSWRVSRVTMNRITHRPQSWAGASSPESGTSRCLVLRKPARSSISTICPALQSLTGRLSGSMAGITSTTSQCLAPGTVTPMVPITLTTASFRTAS